VRGQRAGVCDRDEVVLMDSLLEAQDPDKLLRTLNARVPPPFLAICNPTLGDAIQNFVLDDDSHHVFTTVHGSLDDLQIGDYVYVWNHPLYAVFQPYGNGRGEHAVVSACRTRDRLTGFQVTGHGIPPQTIAQLRSEMLTFLQQGLDLLYVVGTEFLQFL